MNTFIPSAPPAKPNIYAILQRPFPFETDASKRILVSALFGICVAAILLAFTPFGLSRYQGEWKTLIIAFYGMITFSCMMFNYFIVEKIFPKYFDEESWNVGKHISFSLLHILSIGTVNFLYSHFVFSFDFHWLQLLRFIGWTFAIGLFPTIVLTLILERRYWKQNVAAAARISSTLEHQTPAKPHSTIAPKLITLIGSSTKEQYELNPASILCVQAGDNYVTLFYESGEAVKKILFRATLKSLEEQLQTHANFYRCHKSYIANLSNVFKVSGNAQGYKLHLSDLDFVVQVSRSLQTEMLDKLQHIERG
jgi:LytTr DNA-binding domain